MNLFLALVAGMTLTAGLVLSAAALYGDTAPRPAPWRERWRRTVVRRHAERGTRQRILATAAAVLTGILWSVSHNAVGSVLLGSAVIGVPALLEPVRTAQVQIGQLEAVSEWTQRLAGLLRLGMGLEQALITSRKGAPEQLAEPVATLAGRLRTGWRPQQALRRFADDLDDITADKAVCALILSVGDRGPGLAQALEDVAASMRTEVAKKRNIEAERAKSRTTVRWMTLITAGVVAAGFLVPSYTRPYTTLLGQLVLTLLTCGFIGTLALMRHLGLFRRTARFLIVDPRSVITQTVVQTAGTDKEAPR